MSCEISHNDCPNATTTCVTGPRQSADLHFFLLSIEPALSAFNARDEVAHGHPQGTDDVPSPGFFAVHLLGSSQHLRVARGACP
jgi:hypothetical protein